IPRVLGDEAILERRPAAREITDRRSHLRIAFADPRHEEPSKDAPHGEERREDASHARSPAELGKEAAEDPSSRGADEAEDEGDEDEREEIAEKPEDEKEAQPDRRAMGEREEVRHEAPEALAVKVDLGPRADDDLVR